MAYSRKRKLEIDAEILSKIFHFNDPEATRGWLEQEGETSEYPAENRRVVARFAIAGDGEAQLLDLSRTKDKPNIAVVYRRPQISRGRSPRGTILSPLELFLAFRPGESSPEILRRHHERLSRRGIFDSQPRSLPAPLWGAGEIDPDLPPEYGPTALCSDLNWSWFSMGHGVINPSAIMELWTGWSVVTGTSAPRSAAMCSLEGKDNARFDILNQQEGGPWENIFSSDWMSVWEGVGFQVYGPDEGRTRIRLTTQDDTPQTFFAGASWGTPQDWLSS